MWAGIIQDTGGDMKYKKILVANRGEIAVRIIKALRELDIASVAVYSDADRDSLYTKLADQCVCIGDSRSSESYLDTYKILSVADLLDVDAIHPGIGFLAENADFANLCNSYNIDFIGPSGEIISAMGNKKQSKKIAADCALPIIQGSEFPVNTLDDCRKELEKIGYPALLKATNGGGGKGIRVVHSPDDLENCFELCKKESLAAFNSDELIIETYLSDAKHIEVQVLGDLHGNVIHLGERECSIQRSNQKLIEETPSAHIPQSLKEKLYQDAVHLASHIGYAGPGTVEFLVLPDHSYYFMEMNTRLQVEHTITEMVTSFDIVKEQIKIFGGEPLSIQQKDVKTQGYALQCRILSEDPDNQFSASFGKINALNYPTGPGVRVDSAYRCNDTISPFYDSLICKVCSHAPDKETAVKKMLACLDEMHISGVKHNVSLHKSVLLNDDFIRGSYYTNFKLIS